MSVPVGLVSCLVCLTVVAFILLFFSFIAIGKSLITVGLLWVVVVFAVTAFAFHLRDQMIEQAGLPRTDEINAGRTSDSPGQQKSTDQDLPVTSSQNLPAQPIGNDIQDQGQSDAKTTDRQRDGKNKPETKLPSWFEIATGILMLVFTGILAVAAWNLNSITTKQWQSSQDQLSQMARQTELAQGQLKQAKVASAQTDETIKQMRLAQRPWLGIKSASQGKLEVGVPIETVIQVENTGPTPGTILAGRPYGFTTTTGVDITDDITKAIDLAGRYKRTSVIPPGATRTFLTSLSDPVVTQTLIDDIITEKLRFYLVAAYFYVDPTGVSHTTATIFYYDIKSGGFIGYSEYSKMD